MSLEIGACSYLEHAIIYKMAMLTGVVRGQANLGT